MSTSGNDKKQEPKKKKTLADHIYRLGSSSQASEFEVTNRFIINHIRKTFTNGDDIATALEAEQELDLDKAKPKMQVSTKIDPDEKSAESEQFGMEFKIDYQNWTKRSDIYESNKIKVYALLWEQSAEGMQNKIESRTKFEIEIFKNPIKLIKALKEHVLHYQEHRYEMSIILSSMKALINSKQKEGESLIEYTRRFKTLRDVLESHVGGPIILPKYVKSMDGYEEHDPASADLLIGKSWNMFAAYMYLENADQSKYGTLMTGLNTQKTLKNDQCPMCFHGFGGRPSPKRDPWIVGCV